MTARQFADKSLEGNPMSFEDVRRVGITPRRQFAMTSTLILLVTAVSFASVLFLAATLTQSRLSSLTINGVNVALWKLASIQENWDILRKRLVETNKRI